ncbi:hypothetical protein NQ314_007271 [Rhamnusium bicolor]|uniref:Uncharacterized protein n=1 Tax=Rhamnusium bicolor TaxID=1586634 RepID=A0AAV8YSJ4_9CUCU|nr:hypothetical protein NQ314_007271 [Rhamnusium bicolor]
MSDSGSLQNISFSFKEICKVARDIKPDCWCIVASNHRLSFIEINLPQCGPATLQKQLILNNYMQLEAYVGINRLSEEVLSTNDVTSVIELENCLRTFASFGTCLGNRNFHRASMSNSQAKIEYWKHTNCLLLYERDSRRKEQCCDSCLSLNTFLTKKQRKQVIPMCDEFAEPKRIKIDADEVNIKEEIM